MGLVGQRYSKYLKDFVDAAFQFHIVLHYCHKAISDYGTIDLNADCILRSTPELLDAQVLFDPFEEQLHAPSVAVEFGNCLGRGGQVVGQEDVSCTVFRINADHFPQFFRVILRAFINREMTGCIRNHVLRQSPFPGLRLEPDIGFRPDDKESLYAVYRVKIFKIVISTIEDIVGSLLIWNLRHSL